MNPTIHTPDRLRVVLDPTVDAYGQARRLLHLYAERSGLSEDRTETLVQAGAELLVVGGTAPQAMAVCVEEGPEALTVTVDLTGPEGVTPADEASTLLSHLSQDWGWRRLPDGVQVWCDVALEDAAR